MVDLAGDLAGSGGGGVSNYYGVFASRPAAGNAGRMAFLTDAPIATWVDDGTKWRPLINGMLGVQPPLVAAMTGFNVGGASFTDNNGAILVTGVNDGAAPGQQRGMTVAASNFARGTFQFLPLGDVTANHFSAGSILLRESATAKCYALQLYQDCNGRVTLTQATVWTGNATRTVNADKGYGVWDGSTPLTMRARVSGANLLGEWSRDGVNWTQLDSRTVASVFTVGPDQAGWATNCINVVGKFNLISFESG